MALMKVVVLGIDNAGKSSILHILEEKYSQISDLQPTRRIVRTELNDVFGYDIVSWDIPGQAVLREDYVFNIDHTLAETTLIIYVIDVQDTKRIDETLQFYNKVLDKLRSNEQYPFISIFLHKADPDIKNASQINQNINRIKKEIPELSSQFNTDFFITSIFDKWTLFLGFSLSLKELIAKDTQLEVKRILQEFVSENDLLSIFLLDDKNFLLNEYLPTPDSAQLLQDLALMCTFTYKTALENNLATERVKVDLNEATLLLYPLLVNNKKFFILASAMDAQKELLNEIESLITKLSKISIEYFKPK